MQEKKEREKRENQESQREGSSSSSLQQSGLGSSSAAGDDDPASDPRFASFFTDERVEELVQYAIYLGVDLEQQPELVHIIRDLYYAPLPEGWTAHKTTSDCNYGAGYKLPCCFCASFRIPIRIIEMIGFRFGPLCRTSPQQLKLGSFLIGFSPSDTHITRLRTAVLGGSIPERTNTSKFWHSECQKSSLEVGSGLQNE